MAKDLLFATLDPTMRAVTLPDGREVILSDTVGFISDLPTQLVAAFRATLEEVLEADLICHIRDISHAESDEQAADVAAILSELGVGDDRPQFEVWNKIDLLPAPEAEAARVQADRRDEVFAVSALTGEGVAPLLAAVSAALRDETTERVLDLSFAQGRERAWLHDQGVVEAEDQTDTGFHLTVRWTARQEKRFRDL